VGAELPNHTIDGKSIWPVLSGRTTEPQQEAYFFYYNTNELHSVLSGKWKLHFPHGYRTMNGREPGRDGIPGKYDYSVHTGLELYNLANDIGEEHDVSEEHPDIVERLSRLAEAERVELGDRLTGVEGTGKREPGRVAADE
jgi:arylsulfatase